MKLLLEKDLCNQLYLLRNRGAIRLTISKYYLPSGKSISEIGVSPDIKIEEKGEGILINTQIQIIN